MTARLKLGPFKTVELVSPLVFRRSCRTQGPSTALRFGRDDRVVSVCGGGRVCFAMWGWQSLFRYVGVAELFRCMRMTELFRYVR